MHQSSPRARDRELDQFYPTATAGDESAIDEFPSDDGFNQADGSSRIDFDDIDTGMAENKGDMHEVDVNSDEDAKIPLTPIVGRFTPREHKEVTLMITRSYDRFKNRFHERQRARKMVIFVHILIAVGLFCLWIYIFANNVAPILDLRNWDATKCKVVGTRMSHISFRFIPMATAWLSYNTTDGNQMIIATATSSVLGPYDNFEEVDWMEEMEGRRIAGLEYDCWVNHNIKYIATMDKDEPVPALVIFLLLVVSIWFAFEVLSIVVIIYHKGRSKFCFWQQNNEDGYTQVNDNEDAADEDDDLEPRRHRHNRVHM